MEDRVIRWNGQTLCYVDDIKPEEPDTMRQGSHVVDADGDLFWVHAYGKSAKSAILAAKKAGYSVIETVKHGRKADWWLLENERIGVRFTVVLVDWIPTVDPATKVRRFVAIAEYMAREWGNQKDSDKTL